MHVRIVDNYKATRYAIPGGIGSLHLHHIATNSIHSSFHVPLDMVPVSSALGKFIDLFHTPNPMEPIRIGDDIRQFLGLSLIHI